MTRSEKLYAAARTWRENAISEALCIGSRVTNPAVRACTIEAMFSIAEHLDLAAHCADCAASGIETEGGNEVPSRSDESPASQSEETPK